MLTDKKNNGNEEEENDMDLQVGEEKENDDARIDGGVLEQDGSKALGTRETRHFLPSPDEDSVISEDGIEEVNMDEEMVKTTRKFRPFRVATMVHEDGKARTHLDKTHLNPNQCYLILAASAVGQFGAYYAAKEGGKLHDVTLKVYRPQLLGRSQAAIEREILSQNPKPKSIPKLIRSFSFEFQNVLVLEPLNAYSLVVMLDISSSFHYGDAMFFLCEMILAVSYLHSKNIIHGSLKLDSFWIQPTGHIKLTDFSACVQREKRYLFMRMKITHYSAPELLAIGSHSKLVDIWALGVIMYRMISGRMPFQGRSSKDLRRTIRYKKESYSDSFPLSSVELCSLMLEKLPKQRLGYNTSTFDAFKDVSCLSEVDWRMLYQQKFLYQKPFTKMMEIDRSASDVSLNLKAPRYGKSPLRWKPFRYRDITTRSAKDLFKEENLLNPLTSSKVKGRKSRRPTTFQ